jgi:hypothetical protein
MSMPRYHGFKAYNTKKKIARCPSLIKCTIIKTTTTNVVLIVMVLELATQKRTYRLSNRRKKP